MYRGYQDPIPVSFFSKLRTLLLGKSLDPLKPETRRNTLLIAFLAWVGLGADGLSSACYGPETAFLALGHHTHLALYLAIAVAITVFVIAIGYNQVIELFPSGGGGYKVATQLLGPYAGLTSGVALIVDYVLTIAISVASSMDALFSLFPLAWQSHKFAAEIGLLIFLGILNLRGIKESIKFLMPIFLTFFISHALLIIYGIFAKQSEINTLIPAALNETFQLSHQMGWVFVAALFLRAYSLGGGTYTGIEAVSNNVNRLAEPRVKTGKFTMFYMAFSLAFTAGGIILLYLLWHVVPEPGQTLNAVVFKNITHHWNLFGVDISASTLLLVLLSEAGLLFVAANTGYIDGPNVLANMAIDSWVPLQFRHLSSRLVTQNGIILMGIGAGLILLWTKGAVSLLVIMYSINVFLTFSLSLLGLSIYWIKTKKTEQNRFIRLVLSLLGFLVTASILIVTLFEKFEEGGWVTLVITSLLIIVCLQIKKHYTAFHKSMHHISNHLKQATDHPLKSLPPIPLDSHQPTAIFFVGDHLGIGMLTLKKVLSLFPNQYKNFVFLSVATVDSKTMSHEQEIQKIRSKTHRLLSYFVNYCLSRHLPAVHYQSNNTDAIEGLTDLAKKIRRRYPNCVFFAGTLIFEHNNWINYWLHNHTARLVQQRLQQEGLYMMLLPIRITDNGG